MPMQLSTPMETLKLISRNPLFYSHLLGSPSPNGVYDSSYSFLSSYPRAHMSAVNSFVHIPRKHI